MKQAGLITVLLAGVLLMAGCCSMCGKKAAACPKCDVAPCVCPK